ncbi:putative membrane protein [Handroanthus impetiginosus]|uniref:Putative membrane protein n=1 Tax=Handroanthus impetiginosus TaxID=429701 RepID=A0A2G9HMY3_9LAMI|nr:putative membrane protein [Handroanthus impetiginosus]
MKSQVWRWVLGLVYIVLVATIWIAASFVVQSVVDEGVSPFLVTYICNSLFVVYIPLVEIGRYLEDKHGSLLFWRKREATALHDSRAFEKAILLDKDEAGAQAKIFNPDLVAQQDIVDHLEGEVILGQHVVPKDVGTAGLDAKGRWTHRRVAKVSLLICPIWFLAQLTFNLSLKYTTVTSNTILSSSSSLFTFLVALVFLGEKFTWLKLTSVLLCMGGTIIVSLGDSGTESNVVASNPVLGDILALLSSAFYAVYITLIRQKLPDEDDEVQGRASMAQFLGFLGLFNLLLFFPISLVLEFAKLESIYSLTGKELGLIVGKGLLDNVLSDYLWAKAVLLTTTTVATAGLSIQVPLAAIVDSLTGNAPHLLDYIGGAAVLVGFTGINIPSDALCRTKEADLELESGNINRNDDTDL